MTEQSAVPSSPRRHRSLDVARRIGWILAIPAAAYVIWIIAVARNTEAASESAGRIFGFLLALYFVIWLIGVVAHRPGIRGWWGWTIVLSAVAVLVLVALPIGNPQDIAAASYIRDSGGYTYEVDQEDQAAFRAALADSEIPAGDLEEAELYYVRQNGKTVGVLEIMAIRPGVIGASDSFWESIKRGLAKTATSSQESNRGPAGNVVSSVRRVQRPVASRESRACLVGGRGDGGTRRRYGTTFGERNEVATGAANARRLFARCNEVDSSDDSNEPAVPTP